MGAIFLRCLPRSDTPTRLTGVHRSEGNGEGGGNRDEAARCIRGISASHTTRPTENSEGGGVIVGVCQIVGERNNVSMRAAGPVWSPRLREFESATTPEWGHRHSHAVNLHAGCAVIDRFAALAIGEGNNDRLIKYHIGIAADGIR